MLGREQDVALLCVHVEADDAFYPFPNVEWDVASWGAWKVEGRRAGVTSTTTVK